MRSILIRLIALALVALPTVAAADTHTPGFQVQADGLYSTPLGKLPSGGHATLSNLFGNGSGFALTATLGLTQHWCAGVRVATYRSTKSGTTEFIDVGTPLGLDRAAGTGPFELDRELKLVPVQAILQYRRAVGARAEWSADAGLGIVSSTDHLTLRSASTGQLASIAGYQKDPAWTIATSGAWRVPGNLDLIGTVRYCATIAGDGANWASQDDPSFTNWSLGLRYPHDTH